MNKVFFHIAVLGLLLTSSSCSLLNLTKTGAEEDTEEAYFEDLSTLRRPLEKPAGLYADRDINNEEFNGFNHDKTDSITMVLDSIAILKKQKNTYRAYTIQVHSSTNYEEAKKVMGTALREFKKKGPSLSFQQPSFKVRIGKYDTEFEAYAMLKEAREVFPSAIIVPEFYPIFEAVEE